MYEKSKLSAQCISRKLLKWQLLSTSLAIGHPSPFFYLRGSEVNQLLRLSHFCHIWPIQADSFVCGIQRNISTTSNINIRGFTDHRHGRGNLTELGPNDQMPHHSHSFLHPPILVQHLGSHLSQNI